MSMYTTEVRYICETAYGLTESKGADSVDEIIKGCLDKVFDFDFPIFDENYRSVLETKILKHYYTREIGLETVGLWKLKLNTKLNEIMPYYNKLYDSELIEFNPLYNKNVTRKGNKDGKSDRSDNESINDTTNVTANGVSNTRQNDYGNGGHNIQTGSKDLYSDTPQGTVTNLENQTYLTNARIISAGEDGTEYNNLDRTVNADTTTNSKTDYGRARNGYGQVNTVEDYLENVVGYEGNPNKMILDYRNTFLNIDMMVIDELEELFFGLW